MCHEIGIKHVRRALAIGVLKQHDVWICDVMEMTIDQPAVCAYDEDMCVWILQEN